MYADGGWHSNKLNRFRWIFELLLGADANMRMVRKKVSSEVADPTLSPGWSYFCEVSKYMGHLETYGDQKETVRQSTFIQSVLLLINGRSGLLVLNIMRLTMLTLGGLGISQRQE